jgi:hypothetical protein
LDALPAHHPFSQVRSYLKQSRGWEAQAQLVFEANASTERIRDVLAGFRAHPQVAHLDGGPIVRDELVRGLPPLTADLVSREYKVSAAGERYFATTGESKVDVFLKDADLRQVEELSHFAEQVCGSDCFLSGELVAFVDAAGPLIHTLFESMLISLGLVAAVLVAIAFWFGLGPKAALMAVASSVWGTAALLCILVASGIPITVVSCVVLSVLIGLTGDNLVQYLFAGAREGLQTGVTRVGLASIHCSSILILISLLLAGSYVRDLRSLGILLACGLFLSLAGDLWILKGLALKPDDHELTRA